MEIEETKGNQTHSVEIKAENENKEDDIKGEYNNSKIVQASSSKQTKEEAEEFNQERDSEDGSDYMNSDEEYLDNDINETMHEEHYPSNTDLYPDSNGPIEFGGHDYTDSGEEYGNYDDEETPGSANAEYEGEVEEDSKESYESSSEDKTYEEGATISSLESSAGYVRQTFYQSHIFPKHMLTELKVSHSCELDTYLPS